MRYSLHAIHDQLGSKNPRGEIECKRQIHQNTFARCTHLENGTKNTPNPKLWSG